MTMRETMKNKKALSIMGFQPSVCLFFVLSTGALGYWLWQAEQLA